MKNQSQSERNQRVNGAKSPLDQEQPGGMSEREAEKWLKRLDLPHGSHGYKIEVENPEEGGDNAKPW